MVVTVSAEPREDLQAFAAEHPYSLISAYLKNPDEPSVRFISELETQPVTFVIDRQGVVRDAQVGGQEYDAFVAAVGKYL